MSTNLFSPFFCKFQLTETHQIKAAYLEKILLNYENRPDLSPDWNVHTSYNCEDQLLHRLDWNLSLNIYEKYIDKFFINYFAKIPRYRISGTPWYTAYGPGQGANIHEHLPDHFSIVHFLKFDPAVHWPITFINPNNGSTKILLDSLPSMKELVNFNDPKQSYFHPRYTPDLQEGDLIIFPSQLEHMVEKSDAEELRVSIAFNIKLINK